MLAVQISGSKDWVMMRKEQKNMKNKGLHETLRES